MAGDLSDKPLTAEEISHFYKDRGIRADCEVCSKNDWHVLDRLTKIEGAPGILMTPSIAGTTVICRNCGNDRFHAQWVYEIWRKKNPTS